MDNTAKPVSTVDRRDASERQAPQPRFEKGEKEETILPAGESMPGEALIDGVPATFDNAVAEAAGLIRASALPVFAHLGVDVAGAREAVFLAELAGGVLDHAASGALLKDLDPIRETGGFQTTPLEAKVRADVVLLVGASLTDPDWLVQPARPYREDLARRVIRIRASDAPSGHGVEVVETGDGVKLLMFLASLRARVKGRRLLDVPAGVDALATTLLGARFGVAAWSAGELEPLAVEAIHGLVRDLNEVTRFSTLAAAAGQNALGVQTVCGWMTGFPLRTGFVRGRPVHDPWRYDAVRLVASGEADCVIWVASLDDDVDPPRPVDIALCGSRARPVARVTFAVARPGVECDAVLYDPRVGTLIARRSPAATTAPTVATTLAAIRARLEAPPC
jgi:formylmethanofuran dehydrogenase subunit B